MTTYKTWADLRDKVRKDLSLEDEIIVDDDELLGYANEAIDAAEAEIHGLYEDYFLAKGTLTLVSGTAEYDLPADTYAEKIRDIVYRNGSVIFTIDRLRDRYKFEQYELDQVNNVGRIYRHMILNQTAGSPKIVLTPTPQETGAFVTVYYLRNANVLTGADADICDIPEFGTYIIQYMKVRCYEKEVGHPMLEKSRMDLEAYRNQMVNILSDMVPDLNNEIEPDFKIYQEMT